MTSARSTLRPRIRDRASTQASGTPRTSETTVARVAETSDSRSACPTSGAASADPDGRPRRPDHQPDQREHQEEDAHGRGDQGGAGMPAPRAPVCGRRLAGRGHGARNPASSSARRPASVGQHEVDERLRRVGVRRVGEHAIG